MSSEKSRKVLEDIQRAKSKLLKDGAAASLGISYSSSPQPSGGTPSFNSDVHLSPATRSAMQVLQQASMTSYGYFVAQDSHFGNSILPVLPRIEPAAALSFSNITTAVPSPIKTEK
ncbi:SOSS complex subunit C homolog [Folsomia candida]|uniref:SOSS complex subunit C n=1 Tax=Folsomia candida TaxID=158441 RepID=A0A226EHC9_FOLCA|nr:SOSS complex subunit C homolog [Folsomia candida]XP_035707139.1 SOSS complex subunit C homolog [Folsomia candida]OXA56658.1 SOSS complex subunit C [Folsomia candida]